MRRLFDAREWAIMLMTAQEMPNPTLLTQPWVEDRRRSQLGRSTSRLTITHQRRTNNLRKVDLDSCLSSSDDRELAKMAGSQRGG